MKYGYINPSIWNQFAECELSVDTTYIKPFYRIYKTKKPHIGILIDSRYPFYDYMTKCCRILRRLK